jgi:cytochrome b involved in lipid metabolism
MFEFLLSILKKNKGEQLYCKLNNSWYDLREFAELHPGGKKILEKFHLEDITERFYKISYHNYIDLKEFEKYKIKELQNYS